MSHSRCYSSAVNEIALGLLVLLPCVAEFLPYMLGPIC